MSALDSRHVIGWMPRGCFEPGGFAYYFREASGMDQEQIPRNVAGWNLLVGGGRVAVTWDDLMDKRRERQCEELRRKREVDVDRVVPAQVWVFFNKVGFAGFFTGWYCCIRVLTPGMKLGGLPMKMIDVNTRGRGDVAIDLMRRFDFGLGDDIGLFDEWMKRFARRYPRAGSRVDRRKAGIFTGWSDGRYFYRTKQEALAKTMPRNLYGRSKRARREAKRKAVLS